MIAIALLAATVGPTRPAAALPDGPHAVWLGHGWVNGTPEQPLPELLDLLQQNDVGILIVNLGRLDEHGRNEDRSATLKRWLDGVAAWEQKHGHRFELWAWLSAKTSRTNLLDPAVRQAIVDEARSQLAVRGPGGRGFDGILTDIEPVGLDEARFQAYLELVAALQAAAGSGRTVAVAAPRYSPQPPTSWFWGPAEFARMAEQADALVVSTYNTGMSNEPGVTGHDYAAWIEQQVRDILAAVAPTARPGFRLYLSAPAYPPLVHANGSISHDPGVENVRYAVRGIRRAAAALSAAGAPELQHLA
ncbi:MAG TPA: hypothetical protein VIL95_00610, partial [Bacillota bacterium]